MIYQGLTIYLLLAIGWHGGEELAKISPEHRQRGRFHAAGLRAQLRDRILAYVLLAA